MGSMRETLAIPRTAPMKGRMTRLPQDFPYDEPVLSFGTFVLIAGVGFLAAYGFVSLLIAASAALLA
jgi:hypothetical protein